MIQINDTHSLGMLTEQKHVNHHQVEKAMEAEQPKIQT